MLNNYDLSDYQVYLITELLLAHKKELETRLNLCSLYPGFNDPNIYFNELQVTIDILNNLGYNFVG